MASDASIYGLIQPQKPMAGPMDQMGQMLQLKHLMDSGALNELQRTQLQRGMDSEMKLRDLFSRGTPSVEDVMAIDPSKGMQFQKASLENKKLQGEIGKTELESAAAESKYYRDLLAGVRDQGGWDRVIQLGKSRGARFIEQLPPQFSPEAQQQVVMTADQFIKSIAPDYQPVAAGGSTVMVQKNPNAPGFSAAPIAHTATPEGLAADARAAATLAEQQRHHRATEANAALTAGVPAGYRRTADGKGLEKIPGGPADEPTAT